MYHYSLEHVQTLKMQCFSARLSMPEPFRFSTVEELQAVYNGIGPEAWAPGLRSIVTALLDRFEPEALIHDWEYMYQPKTWGHFTAANLRFAWNAFICACSSADSRKNLLIQTGAGIALALLCQIFGWKAFQDTETHQQKKG